MSKKYWQRHRANTPALFIRFLRLNFRWSILISSVLWKLYLLPQLIFFFYSYSALLFWRYQFRLFYPDIACTMRSMSLWRYARLDISYYVYDMIFSKERQYLDIISLFRILLDIKPSWNFSKTNSSSESENFMKISSEVLCSLHCLIYGVRSELHNFKNFFSSIRIFILTLTAFQPRVSL